MIPEKTIEKRVEETLNSLEGLGKAEASPFFYRKLEARMQNELDSAPSRFALVGNLRLSMAVLTVFMVVNLITLFSIGNGSEVETSEREDQIASFAQEYFSGSDDYEYLNDY